MGVRGGGGSSNKYGDGVLVVMVVGVKKAAYNIY